MIIVGASHFSLAATAQLETTRPSYICPLSAFLPTKAVPGNEEDYPRMSTGPSFAFKGRSGCGYGGMSLWMTRAVPLSSPGWFFCSLHFNFRALESCCCSCPPGRFVEQQANSRTVPQSSCPGCWRLLPRWAQSGDGIHCQPGSARYQVELFLLHRAGPGDPVLHDPGNSAHGPHVGSHADHRTHRSPSPRLFDAPVARIRTRLELAANAGFRLVLGSDPEGPPAPIRHGHPPARRLGDGQQHGGVGWLGASRFVEDERRRTAPGRQLRGTSVPVRQDVNDSS